MAFVIINNFKCFRDERIELNDLTVLVGSNGMGKSTVIQALLLMRQFYESKSETILLNGPYSLELGSYESVISKDATNGQISFHLLDENADYFFAMDLAGGNETVAYSLKTVKVNLSNKQTGLLSEKFSFLSAERSGPRICQRMIDQKYHSVGVFGEYTAQVLSNKFFKVVKERCHPSIQSPFLKDQVNAWLDFILPGNNVTAISDTNMQVAQIKLRNQLSDDFVVAPNLGFGISYSLPIIVAGLIADNGSYMIIENPEAHLHPAAQTSMGQFLAGLSKTGVKVIIETHSDHILDGIQIYIAEHPDFRESVLINNFSNIEGKVQVTPIRYNENIEYTEWPKGFMDSSLTNYCTFTNIKK